MQIGARLEKIRNGEVSNSGPNVTTEAQLVVLNQINSLQGRIFRLSVQKRPVAVIGFKNCGGIEDAKNWINAKCTEFGVTIPTEMWCPKSGFKGLMFAKFGDTSIRDKFVSKVVVMKPEYEGVQVWSRIKTPPEVRACEVFLSGLKKILVGWGFDQTIIKYDTESTEKTLEIKNEIKVSVSVRDGSFGSKVGKSVSYSIPTPNCKHC